MDESSLSLPFSNSLSRWLPSRNSLVFAALLFLLLVVAITFLTSGAIEISANQVVAALWQGALSQPLASNELVVTLLRLPRLVFGMLVGAGLAAAGVASQGLFRNPLADPAMIGVSAGAALGATLMIVLGASLGFTAELGGSVALGAFIGGLIATFLVWIIGHARGSVATLLLAGIAINAIVFAAIGLMQYLANDQQLRDLTFWSLGSLGGASWGRLMWVAPCILIPLLLFSRHTKALNALLLGEHEAAFLGFAVKSIQRQLLVLIALSVSAAVAFTGVISFVGLVVPHLLRLIMGPDHRQLLPASALGGALLVPLADTFARTLAAPAELPLGVLIALLGGPFFLWLLLRTPISERF